MLCTASSGSSNLSYISSVHKFITVAYATLQTAVLGTSPLTIYAKRLSKWGTFTRQCHLLASMAFSVEAADGQWRGWRVGLKILIPIVGIKIVYVVLLNNSGGRYI